MNCPSQGSLFPYAQPVTAVACCRRLEGMVLAIGPELTRANCFEMLCELSTVFSLCDRIRITPPTHGYPYAKPETVLEYCRDLAHVIAAIAPALTTSNCLRLLEELMLVTSTLERIDETIRRGPDFQLRQQLPALPTLPEPPTPADRLAPVRAWRSVHRPIVYERTQTPAWRRWPGSV